MLKTMTKISPRRAECNRVKVSSLLIRPTLRRRLRLQGFGAESKVLSHKHPSPSRASRGIGRAVQLDSRLVLVFAVCSL